MQPTKMWMCCCFCLTKHITLLSKSDSKFPQILFIYLFLKCSYEWIYVCLFVATMRKQIKSTNTSASIWRVWKRLKLVSSKFLKGEVRFLLHWLSHPTLPKSVFNSFSVTFKQYLRWLWFMQGKHITKSGSLNCVYFFYRSRTYAVWKAKVLLYAFALQEWRDQRILSHAASSHTKSWGRWKR